MAGGLGTSVRVCETSVKWVWQRPVTFDEFLDLFMGREELVELIDGTVMEREMVQLDHEKVLLWLTDVLRPYVRERRLGIVLGSRTAVKIAEFRGRLPDLVFVSNERMDMVQQRGVFGDPDLVIEVTSPGDRQSDRVSLEADYCMLGVHEIVFVDPAKRRIRVLRRNDAGYVEQVRVGGRLSLDTVPGFRVDVSDLFASEDSSVLPTLHALLAEG